MRESSFTIKYVPFFFFISPLPVLYFGLKCDCAKLTRYLCYSFKKIQPIDSEYKEGREYILSEFVKEGSYGEVYSAQDVNTGFKFAVKKVRQCISASLFFH